MPAESPGQARSSASTRLVGAGRPETDSLFCCTPPGGPAADAGGTGRGKALPCMIPICRLTSRPESYYTK